MSGNTSPGKKTYAGPRNYIKALLSLIVTALLIWHAVTWHHNGTHVELFGYIKTDKAVLSVLYNLGLVAAISTALSLLMGSIMDIVAALTGRKNAAGKKDGTRP